MFSLQEITQHYVSYTKVSIFVHVVFNITMPEASEFAP